MFQRALALAALAFSLPACHRDLKPANMAATPIAEVARLAADCAVPAAIADDGLDDRAAIQAALDAGHCAALGAGTYEIVTPAAPPGGRRPYAMLSVAAANLSGVGAATVLRFSGDAGGAQDWYGIALGSNGLVRDLRIFTGDLVGTVEQTHGIRITGPALAPVITRVVFDHPRRGLPGGDCVQLVGYPPSSEILGARITDDAFLHCDRSAVGVHSGAHDLQITGCSFPSTGDTDIDFEGSGDIDQVLIANNTFSLDAGAQGDQAIELDKATNVRITGCTLDGRGIHIFDSSHIGIDHNVITRRTLGSSGGVLEISKGSADVAISTSTITRTAAATPGPVVRATPHGTGTPSGLAITDSLLVQATGASIVLTSGVVGLMLDRDVLRYTGSGAIAYGVDATGSPSVRTDQLAVANTFFDGPLSANVRVSGSYAGTGSLSCSGNTGMGAAQGLRCENVTSGARVLGPVTLTGNTWPPLACGPAGFVLVN